MSLYSYPINELWNSEYMSTTRRKMHIGQEVNACKVCYSMEEELGDSYRIFSNNEWKGLIDSFGEIIDASKKNNYKVLEPPISYHLILGTLCNLKCRMCNTLWSSQVRRGPIHSQWCLPSKFLEPDIIKWQKGSMTIGPEPIVGVETSGLYEPEIYDNRMLRWTQGDTSLSFQVPLNLSLQNLKIKIWEYHPGKYSLYRRIFSRLHRKKTKGHSLKVFINEKLLFGEEMAKGAWEKIFDLSEGNYSGAVTVRLLSDTFRVPLDSRMLGVALEEIEVTCVESGQALQTQTAAKQDPSLPERPWHDQTEWILNDLLKKPEALRELYFSGGEPMLQKQVEGILEFCIERRAAAQVRLKFNTNCTVVRESLLEKLSHFQNNWIAFSIDAIGPYWEYIRYPLKWDRVVENISKFADLPKTCTCMVPVLQVYNALNIVQLMTYCDSIGKDCWLYPLTSPWFLDVAVLPLKARKLAGERLRQYAGMSSRPDNARQAMNMADYIDSLSDKSTSQSLRTLMLFTNDLDATRKQSFRETHPELLSIIEETGFRWTDERQFT